MCITCSGLMLRNALSSSFDVPASNGIVCCKSREGALIEPSACQLEIVNCPIPFACTQAEVQQQRAQLAQLQLREKQLLDENSALRGSEPGKSGSRLYKVLSVVMRYSPSSFIHSFFAGLLLKSQ